MTDVEWWKSLREASERMTQRTHLAGKQQVPCTHPDCGRSPHKRGYITPSWVDHHPYGSDEVPGELCPTCKGAGSLLVPATTAQQAAAICREMDRLAKKLAALGHDEPSR